MLRRPHMRRVQLAAAALLVQHYILLHVAVQLHVAGIGPRAIHRLAGCLVKPRCLVRDIFELGHGRARGDAVSVYYSCSRASTASPGDASSQRSFVSVHCPSYAYPRNINCADAATNQCTEKRRRLLL